MRYVTLALCLAVAACSSTLPDIPEAPEVDVQTVYLDKPCIVNISAPAPNTLPDYPPFDESDPAGWAKEVRRIYKIREVRREAEIDALRHVIDEHNLLEPKCSP